VKAGGSVFVDAGTTCLALIRCLQDTGITIFTTGANFAAELARLQNPTINLCPGTLNRSNMALSGHSTLAFLEGINIDMGFVGVSGYSDESGFTCGKESEMLVKRLVIQKARTSVALMDASKLTRLLPYTFAALPDVGFLVMDQEPPAPLRCALRPRRRFLL
jgi:DeoR family transcriptional regulator of aga operon